MTSPRLYRTLQALVMGGLGIFLLSKVMDGRILFYINQRFVLLVLLAALGLMFLAQFALRESPPPSEPLNEHEPHPGEAGPRQIGHLHAEPRRGWVLWLLALPVLMGLLIPEQPLGASVLKNRGINTASGLAVRGSLERALALPPEQRTVQDWIRIYAEAPDVQPFEGQPVDVTGFVYHDIRLGAGQYLLGRFSIACCVADAVALGMVVEEAGLADDGGTLLPDNTWVRVRGILRSTELEGRRLPMIEARQVEIVPQPDQPYLFP